MADVEMLLGIHRSKLDMNLVREYFDLFNRGKELDEILERGKTC